MKKLPQNEGVDNFLAVEDRFAQLGSVSAEPSMYATALRRLQHLIEAGGEFSEPPEDTSKVRPGHKVILEYLRPRELGAETRSLIAVKSCIIGVGPHLGRCGDIAIIPQHWPFARQLLGRRQDESILCVKYRQQVAELRICGIEVPSFPVLQARRPSWRAFFS